MVSHVSSADPDAHVWDDTVWVYTSTDGNLREHGYSGDSTDPWTYAYMDGYHVFSSTDMINWQDHGEVFHSRDVAWGGDGWMWAPGAARRDGTYYLYYPHKVCVCMCMEEMICHGIRSTMVVVSYCVIVAGGALTCKIFVLHNDRTMMGFGESELPQQVNHRDRFRTPVNLWKG